MPEPHAHTVGDYIERAREVLIDRFVETAGTLESARGLHRYELIDTFPEYLSTLVAISRLGRRAEPEATRSRLEKTHMSLRLRQGYTQEEVTTEYVIMGRLISELWEGVPSDEKPPGQDVQLLFDELGAAMDHVVAVFTGYTAEDRQREKRLLRRLDGLAPTTLHRGGGLGERLGPLVDVIQDALGADGAELYLVDENRRHLAFAAATGLCSPPPQLGFVPLESDAFVATTARSELPLIRVREAPSSRGFRTRMGLRLWPRGALLGVIFLAFRDAKPIEPQSQRLFETLVEYLSGILDRGLLFEQVRVAEERLRMALKAASLGTWDLDSNTGHLGWDERCKELFGLPPTAEVTYDAFLAAVHPDDRERVDGLVQQALDPRGGGEFDTTFRTIGLQDGLERWIRSIGRALFDGESAVRFIGAVQDISALKAAEKALQRSEREFRTVTEAMPQLVWTARPDGQVDYANPRLADYLGERTEAFLSSAWSQVVHPEDLEAFEKVWARCVATGEPLQIERRLRGGDGVYRWFLTRAVSIRDEQDRVRKWLGTSTDIDDLKRTEADVRQRAEFEQQLIGIVSHDLRNPLNAIRLSGQTLQRSEELSDRQARSVARILTAAERATRLIRDLLDFTRARLGRGIPVKPAPLDLHAAVSGAVDEVRHAHPGRNIEVERSGDGTGCWDGDRVAQIVSNLVNNAIAYSPRESTVRVETRGGDGEVLIQIHNEGKPIPPEMIPQLFAPLRRGTSEASSERSIGLGLFIVRSIVAAHHGTVDVLSTTDEGTRFTVRLPRKPL